MKDSDRHFTQYYVKNIMQKAKGTWNSIYVTHEGNTKWNHNEIFYQNYWNGFSYTVDGSKTGTVILEICWAVFTKAEHRFIQWTTCLHIFLADPEDTYKDVLSSTIYNIPILETI